MESVFNIPSYGDIKSKLIAFLETCDPRKSVEIHLREPAERECEEFREVIETDIDVETLVENNFIEEFEIELGFEYINSVIKDLCNDKMEQCIDLFEQSHSRAEQSGERHQILASETRECYNEIKNEFESREIDPNKSLFRGMSVDSLDELNTKSIGRFWSFDKENAEEVWCNSLKCPRFDIVLEAYPVSIDAYDIDESFISNFIFKCRETEIRLKEGSKIKVKNVCITEDIRQPLKCYNWKDQWGEFLTV
jgi:hypothetical protein